MKLFELLNTIIASGLLALMIRFAFSLGQLSADVRRIKAHLGLNGPADGSPPPPTPDGLGAEFPPYLVAHHQRLLAEGRVDDVARSAARWRIRLKLPPKGGNIVQQDVAHAQSTTGRAS